MKQNEQLIQALAQGALNDFLTVTIDPKIHLDPLEAIRPRMMLVMATALTRYLDNYVTACNAPPCACIQHQLWRGEAWMCSCKQANPNLRRKVEVLDGRPQETTEERLTHCVACNKERPK